MTDNLNIIGDNQRKSRFDPNLAEQVNREVEEQERKKAVEENLGEKKQEVQKSEPEPLIPANAPDMKGFIYVPSIGIYVAKQRSLHGLDWIETHFKLNRQGLFMPTIFQFKEYIKYLKDDKNGYKNRKEADSILDDILGARDSWRFEWLDALFKKKSRGLFKGSDMMIQYAGKTEALDNCLMQNKQIKKCFFHLDDWLKNANSQGIDLDDWLNNANSQGLPKQDVKNGNLDYWKPVNGRVAGFYADSDTVALDCRGRGRGSVHPAIGVFACYKNVQGGKSQ